MADCRNSTDRPHNADGRKSSMPPLFYLKCLQNADPTSPKRGRACNGNRAFEYVRSHSIVLQLGRAERTRGLLAHLEVILSQQLTRRHNPPTGSCNSLVERQAQKHNGTKKKNKLPNESRALYFLFLVLFSPFLFSLSPFSYRRNPDPGGAQSRLPSPLPTMVRAWHLSSRGHLIPCFPRRLFYGGPY